MRKLWIIPFVIVLGLLFMQGKKIPARIDVPINDVFFKPFFYTVPNQHFIYLAGEYQSGLIDLTTKTFYNINAVLISESHLTAGKIIGGAAGPHHICVFDTSGNVSCRAPAGANANGAAGNGTTSDVNNFTQVAVDSLGNTFTGVVAMWASSSARGWNTWALTASGKLYAWGALDGGMEGNGTDGNLTATRPVQIVFPGGALISKAQCGFSCEALSTTGDVYTWGCNYSPYPPYVLAQCTASPVTNTPTKITLPHPAIDIANNGQAAFALLNNGSLYGWAFWTGYTGVGAAADGNPQNPSAGWASLCPGLLDTANTAAGFPGAGRTIAKIFSGSVNNYAILSDSTLWVQGDEANGGFGDGSMMNWATYSSPYNWSQSYGELLHRKWKQMAVGQHNFVDVATGPALVYYAVFEDANGSLYWCGRDKGAIIADGKGGLDSIGGEMQSARPNSWNNPWLTKFDPFKTIPHIIRTSSEYCVTNSGAAECVLYPVLTSGSPPTAVLSNTTITIRQGQVLTIYGTTTVTSPAKDRYQSYWTHDAGGSYFLPVPGGDTVQFWSQALGAHVLTYHAKDDHFKNVTATCTVIVGCSSCAIRPQGGRHKKQNI